MKFDETFCPGCNGIGELIDTKGNVFRCLLCDGLFSPSTTPTATLKHVNYMEWHSEPDKVAGENWRYFDFTYSIGEEVHRIHGWMDRKSRQLLQLG